MFWRSQPAVDQQGLLPEAEARQASLCSSSGCSDCSGSVYASPKNITERLWQGKMGRVACDTVRVLWYVALEAYTRAGREDRQARAGFPCPQTASSSMLAPSSSQFDCRFLSQFQSHWSPNRCRRLELRNRRFDGTDVLSRICNGTGMGSQEGVVRCGLEGRDRRTNKGRRKSTTYRSVWLELLLF